MMLSDSICGYVVTNIAGRIAKYFATSLAIENVVNRLRKKSGFCYAPGLPAGIMEASLLDFLR
jgi:hypothetical protein